jgi:holo-[acyl-carrier protein] synthase
MILGFGSDIVDIRRIEAALKKQGVRFETRVFTPTERKKAATRKKAGAKIVAATYAKRFAAKEAAAKALGCGIGKHLSFQDIEIGNTVSQAPKLTLSGNGAKWLTSLTPRGHKARLLVTLADEYPYAIALVMIVAEPKKNV